MSAAKQRGRLSSKNIKDGFFRTLSPPPPSDRKVHIFLLCRCYFSSKSCKVPSNKALNERARAKSTSELKDWQKRQCPERGGGERCNASISRSRLHACEAAKGQGRAGQRRWMRISQKGISALQIPNPLTMSIIDSEMRRIRESGRWWSGRRRRSGQCLDKKKGDIETGLYHREQWWSSLLDNVMCSNI